MNRRRAAVLLLSAFLLLAATGQARAAGYRYWSFWERDGGHWTYATQGPSLTRPSDGDVQGFRFAVSEDSADATRPRGEAGFADICAETPARKGAKRVALVLDFGTAADAPSGEKPPARRTVCARVAPDATTSEALASVAKPLRYDTNALLCAISGYPEKGCGEQVAAGGERPAKGSGASSADADGDSDDRGARPSVGLLAGGAVVLVLAAAGVLRARRRAR